MASVFKRGDVWIAKVHLWDARRGAWVWRQVATGLREKSGALAVALALEGASGEAKGGLLNRERAVDLVNVVLRLAGLPLVEGAPGTWGFAKELVEAVGLAGKSRAKYLAAWEAFRSWAGSDRALDAWGVADFQRYYDGLLVKVAVGTANDHLRFWRSVFNKGQRLGILRVNPVAGVVKRAAVAAGKVAFSRGDLVRVVRLLRAEGRRDWLALVLLGWHTGARLQDVLDLGAGSFAWMESVGWVVRFVPGKTGGREVVLPVPGWLAGMVRGLGGFGSLGRGGSNYNGRISNEFVEVLRRAGVDPMPVRRVRRIVHLKSFHSFRHSLASRLAAAGVSGQVARLVTAHASEVVHAGYVHAEILSVAGALRAARRK